MEYLEIKGLESFFKACEKLVNMDKYGQSIMTSAGESIKNSIDEAFKKETSPFGEKWKALSPKTIKQKIKKGENNGILKREENLSSNWYIESSSNQVKVFNNSQSKKGFKYGYVHQWGNKKRNIPARAFLPIDKNMILHKDIRSVIYKDTKDFIKKFYKN